MLMSSSALTALSFAVCKPGFVAKLNLAERGLSRSVSKPLVVIVKPIKNTGDHLKTTGVFPLSRNG
jgi:hypothetical protein